MPTASISTTRSKPSQHLPGNYRCRRGDTRVSAAALDKK
jgi:hypothetical protein